MSAHTPGPWFVSPPTRENPSEARVTALAGGVRIYEAPLTRETEANAHLIAAAPDMLAALERLLSSALIAQPYNAQFFAPVVAAADAAIAKARGGK
jgi:hypothetical protein